MKVITGNGVNVRKYIETLKDKTDVIVFSENGLDINEQAAFMSNLSDSFDGTIITFSPWIISDTLEENLYTVSSELKLIEADFISFGSSVNKINMKVLGRRKTIGDKSYKELENYSKKLKTTDNLDNLINNLDKNLGESVEKVLILKSVL